MKKMLVFAGIISTMQVVYAGTPEQPWLISPQSSKGTLPTNLPVAFSWDNNKDASITSYRVIVSTTENFSGYNTKTKACTDKTTCFIATSKTKSYVLRKTSSILKNDKNYYWRVEAINADGTAISDIRAFSFGTPAIPLDAKYSTSLPLITTAGTDVTTVEKGQNILFSATLDQALASSTGYKVKVNFGNGFKEMTDSAGAGINFGLSASPLKSASYTIGIYDARNNLKSNKKTGKFTVTAPAAGNVAPVLKLIGKAETVSKGTVNLSYSVELSATDINGNLKQIFITWGDGASDSVEVSEGKSVLLSHTYTAAGNLTWKASADDYAELSSNEISQDVVISEPVIPATTSTTTPTTSTTTDTPKATSPYKAINSAGAVTTDNRDWACTQDEKGLFWELKTNDNGLHSKKWTYSWYNADTATNGGYAGNENLGVCKGSKCNTAAFIDVVNKEKLCGKDTWRLPTKAELMNLVTCSDEKSISLSDNEKGTICIGKPTMPTIDKGYFPYTQANWYWTSETYIPETNGVKPLPSCASVLKLPVISTPVGEGTEINTKPYPDCTINSTGLSTYDSAWNVNFYYGQVTYVHKANALNVMLVSE